MKWILVFILLFIANCASQTNALVSENTSNQNITNINTIVSLPPPTVTNKPAKVKNDSDLCDDSEPLAIPKTDSSIGKIDFNNLAYPRIWEKGSIKLQNGCFGREYTKPGLGIETFSLKNIDFVDFNNDGKDEALVKINWFSGSGSSGVSEQYFIYGLNGKKLNLLWKISTGARAYCGQKEFELKDKKIFLELFGTCALENDGNFKDRGKHRYDYSAFEYTKFTFGWSGNKFVITSREVLPFPENDIKDYLNKKYTVQNENNN
jgi:hypothetical protein